MDNTFDKSITIAETEDTLKLLGIEAVAILCNSIVKEIVKTTGVRAKTLDEIINEILPVEILNKQTLDRELIMYIDKNYLKYNRLYGTANLSSGYISLSSGYINRVVSTKIMFNTDTLSIDIINASKSSKSIVELENTLIYVSREPESTKYNCKVITYNKESNTVSEKSIPLGEYNYITNFSIRVKENKRGKKLKITIYNDYKIKILSELRIVIEVTILGLINKVLENMQKSNSKHLEKVESIEEKLRMRFFLKRCEKTKLEVSLDE